MSSLLRANRALQDVAGPVRRLTSTERAERYGMPRPTEAQYRAMKVERLLAQLDRMWTESGKDPRAEARRTIVRLRAWTPEQWHWLGKCADGPAAKAPSAKTQKEKECHTGKA